jgi:transposase
MQLPVKTPQPSRQRLNILSKKGVEPCGIKQLRMDMLPSFISGAMSSFTNVAITFDKFHVGKEVNNAMDNLRRPKAKQLADLRGTKYTFLKNDKNLNKTKKAQNDILLGPRLSVEYRIKTMFSEYWDTENIEEAGAFLAY